ncbi:hypothetical protein B0H17DRAFT_1201239 [Mycena rosella]|uniref:Uncharacterized protein n=1 Tax=Mycena rosella TaxID=1033263 RepID=A0AAD7DH40_MYCRO|nr:hypothetical protein B0H17DRAFT_1201239 [Mycena rosella]
MAMMNARQREPHPKESVAFIMANQIPSVALAFGGPRRPLDSGTAINSTGRSACSPHRPPSPTRVTPDSSRVFAPYLKKAELAYTGDYSHSDSALGDFTPAGLHGVVCGAHCNG